MIFVDASAIVAIIAREADWERLADTITLSGGALVSPLCLWEATIALTRNKVRSFEEAEQFLATFISTFDIRTMPVTAEIGTLALDASRRFGRGRHKADLNFGDCFAYACARHRGVPLLFKGEDFVQTDIEAA